MMNDGPKPFQTEVESLHWISYNLKQLTKEVKSIGLTLNALLQNSGNNRPIAPPNNLYPMQYNEQRKPQSEMNF